MSKQQLGFFDLSMIVVSLVIGMGIFKNPALVAASADNSFIFFLAWTLGGLISVFGALTFAEIGSRLPVSGGYYKVFSHCYHPAFAFMLNGTILISNAASVAGVALIGSEYLSKFIPGSSLSEENKRIILSFCMISIFFALNLLGLKTSARTQNVLTVFKLVVVTVLCFSIFIPEQAAGTTLVHTPHTPVGFWKSLGLCLIPVSFTYGGYQQTINFGGEVNDARRIMPRAIIFGMLLVTFLYLSINYAYFKVIGFEQLGRSSSIGATLSERIFGDLGGKILSLLLFFSVLAYVNVGLLSNPRVIMAMSEERTLPPVFSRHSRRFNVPVWSLTAFTIMTLSVLFFAKTFEQLVNYVIFLDTIGFVFAAATVFILRRRRTGEDKPIYRMRIYPVIPVLFILAYVCINAAVIASGWKFARAGLLVFASFIIPYFLFTALNKFRDRK